MVTKNLVEAPGRNRVTFEIECSTDALQTNGSASMWATPASLDSDFRFPVLGDWSVTVKLKRARSSFGCLKD
jgi:hypothetical protein